MTWGYLVYQLLCVLIAFVMMQLCMKLMIYAKLHYLILVPFVALHVYSTEATCYLLDLPCYLVERLGDETYYSRTPTVVRVEMVFIMVFCCVLMYLMHRLQFRTKAE